MIKIIFSLLLILNINTLSMANEVYTSSIITKEMSEKLKTFTTEELKQEMIELREHIHIKSEAWCKYRKEKDYRDLRRFQKIHSRIRMEVLMRRSNTL